MDFWIFGFLDFFYFALTTKLLLLSFPSFFYFFSFSFQSVVRVDWKSAAEGGRGRGNRKGGKGGGGGGGGGGSKGQSTRAAPPGVGYLSPGTACTSDAPIGVWDSEVATCEDFCDASEKQSHCGLCKCRGCDLCKCHSDDPTDSDETRCEPWCSRSFWLKHCGMCKCQVEHHPRRFTLSLSQCPL